METTLDSPGAKGRDVASAPLPQRIGDYEVLEEIARGGMGVVYKARHVSLKRVVALKMILAGHLAGEDEVRRFLAEAEAAAKLDHPHIVPIYEIGQDAGQHYFAMAYVRGRSLAASIADRVLPAAAAARLLRTLAEAIAYAHTQGVIHRDLKPANVLWDEGGEPRITDFGLAKQIAGGSGLTVTGQVLGTPSFMPPEQARGETGSVGGHSDIYSLGAILYCLLTGRPPFKAATAVETVMQVLSQEPVPPRQLNGDVPLDLQTICLKCLEKDPSRRYASAEDLAQELGRYLNGEPLRARPLGPAGRTWRWCRRNPLIAALLSAIALSLLAGAAVSTGFALQAHGHAQQSQESARVANRESRNAKLALSAELRAREESLDVLCRSYFEQARAVRMSEQPGRRWTGLELLQRAQALRTRDRRGVPRAEPAGGLGLPGLLEMRNEALATLLLQDAREVRSFTGSLFAPAISADGTLAAIRRFDGAAANLANGPPRPGGRLVDVRSGQELGRWEHDLLDLGLHYAISPDGKFLAAETRGRTAERKSIRRVKLWELPAGTKVGQTLDWPGDAQAPPPGAQGSILAFSPNGRYLAAHRGSDMLLSEVAVWDITSGKATLFTRLAAGIGGVTFSRDGATLAAFDRGGAVSFWDSAAGGKRGELKLPSSELVGLAFGAQDSFLAAVSGTPSLVPTATAEDRAAARGQVLLWDLHGQRERTRLTIGLPRERAIAFDPQGWKLAIGENSGDVSVIDCKAQAVWARIRGAHSEPLLAVNWCQDSRQLVTAGFEGRIKLWELSVPPPRSTLAIPAATVERWRIRPDGLQLAVAQPQSVLLVDLANGTRERELQAQGNLRFREDGQQLAILGTKAQTDFVLYDLATGAELTRRKLPQANSAVAFRSTGECLLAQVTAQGVEVIEAATGRQIGEFAASQPLTVLQLSPDGQRLACSAPLDPAGPAWRARGLPVRIYDVATGNTLCDANVPDDTFFPCQPAFSPEGRWWAEAYMRMAAGDERSLTPPTPGAEESDMPHGVRIWEASTGRRLPTITNSTMVTSLDFGRNGSLLAIANRLGVVSLHRVSDGQQLLEWTTGRAQNTRVCFAPDGKALFAEGGGSTLLRLDLAAVGDEFVALGMTEKLE